MSTIQGKTQISCPEYESEGGTKRCQHFGADRSCSLLAHPVCEEGLRRNPDQPIPNETGSTWVRENEGYVLAVVEGTYFRPGWKARILDQLSRFDVPATPQAPTETTAPETVSEPVRAVESAEDLPGPARTPEAVTAPAEAQGELAGNLTEIPTEEAFRSFAELGVTVCVVSETLGELWLVPSYTGQPRSEITPEHLMTLRRLLAAFPDSHVSEFIRDAQQFKQP